MRKANKILFIIAHLFLMTLSAIAQETTVRDKIPDGPRPRRLGSFPSYKSLKGAGTIGQDGPDKAGPKGHGQSFVGEKTFVPPGGIFGPGGPVPFAPWYGGPSGPWYGGPSGPWYGGPFGPGLGVPGFGGPGFGYPGSLGPLGFGVPSFGGPGFGYPGSLGPLGFGGPGLGFPGGPGSGGYSQVGNVGKEVYGTDVTTGYEKHP